MLFELVINVAKYLCPKCKVKIKKTCKFLDAMINVDNLSDIKIYKDVKKIFDTLNSDPNVEKLRKELSGELLHAFLTVLEESEKKCIFYKNQLSHSDRKKNE